MAGSLLHHLRTGYAGTVGMGGLVGYVALDGLALEEGSRLLSRMLDALERPSSVGRSTVANQDFGIGARAASGQAGAPWRSPRGDMVVAADGAPRFDPVIQRAVPSTPDSFGPRLRALYDRYEERMFEHIGGPFASVVWDGRGRRLLLGRDGLGQVPLFFGWSRMDRVLLFASEAKALLASGRTRARFDHRGLLDVLSVGHVVPPRTLFAGIERIPPGTWVSVMGRGALSQGRWSKLPYPVVGDEAPEPSSTDGLHAAMDEALRKAPSDLPVALQASASSALLAVVQAERGGGPLRTFGPRFEATGYLDEAASFNATVADWLEAEHAEVLIRSTDEQRFSALVRALEGPVIELDPIWQDKLLSGLGTSGVGAIALADGAGELLAGAKVRLPELRPGPFGRWAEKWSLRSVPGLARSGARSARHAKALGRRLGVRPVGVAGWARLAHVIDRWALSGRVPVGLARFPHHVSAAPWLLAHPLHRALALGLQLGGLEQRLWVGGRLAALHGVQIWRPYCDAAVWNWSAALPPRSLRGRRPLAVVRAALPRSLGRARRRDERAPQPPLPRWPFGLSVPLWVRAALSEPELARFGLFDPKAISEALDRSRGSFGMAAEIESRGLRAVLGLSLLAKSFGIEGVEESTPVMEGPRDVGAGTQRAR